MNRVRCSRRGFLRAGAAAAAWLGGRRAAADTRAESLRRFGGFRFGIQAHSLRNFPVEQAVAMIREQLQLHWVEFSKRHIPLDAPPELLAKVNRLLREGDLTCTALGVHAFKADAAANRRVFQLARAMGARNISANPTPEALGQLEKLAAEYDIRIAIHNHGPGALYDKIADVERAVKGRHPHIGACIDTAHFIRSQEDPVEAIYRLKGRVFGVHVKDVAERAKQTHDVIIGEGFLDVPAMFRALRETGFPDDGALSLEFEGDPENPLPQIQQCLRVAERAARAAAG